MADLLKVRINSPEKIIWEGDAISVSSENIKGPFDILYFHTNFISIVEKKEIRIKTQNEEKKFTFDTSIIYAHANQVHIYTNL
jgi:F-type H+-transporting ATPase subunit epsilon